MNRKAENKKQIGMAIIDLFSLIHKGLIGTHREWAGKLSVIYVTSTWAFCRLFPHLIFETFSQTKLRDFPRRARKNVFLNAHLKHSALRGVIV